MSQSRDSGDERLEMIAELRRSAERQLRSADQLEAEMRAEADQKRRRFRLIKGAGLVAVLLFLRQLIRHNPAVTATAVLTSAASAAVITTAVVTDSSSHAPHHARPRPTVTAPAPGRTTLKPDMPPRPEPPAAPPSAPPRPPVIGAPFDAPAPSPSSPAASLSPLAPTAAPVPSVPTVSPPMRRRRRPQGCPVLLTVRRLSICPPL